jgi:hypothetical protein
MTVPGIHWLAASITGLSGATLLACCWWWSPTAPTDPGSVAVAPHEQQGQGQTTTAGQVVRDLVARWGRQGRCGADRGVARRPVLDHLVERHARGVSRWPTRARLVLRTEPAWPVRTATHAWRMTAGRRKPWGHETIGDPQRREPRTIACFAVPV